MAMTKVSTAKTKTKLTKKELKQDKLVEFTAKAEGFYYRHQKWVVGTAVGVLVVILATVFINRSQKSAQLEESFQLTLAKMSYGMGQLDEAQQGFQRVSTQYSGATAGEARFFLARIAFEKGDYVAAETEFQSYINDYSIDDALDAAALAGLAATYEAQGKLDLALEQHERLAEKYTGNAYAAQSLMQCSRLAQALGQPDRARKALNTILERYPESSSVQQARKELETLD